MTAPEYRCSLCMRPLNPVTPISNNPICMPCVEFLCTLLPGHVVVRKRGHGQSTTEETK